MKVLTDLENGTTRAAIDMYVLKDLRLHLLTIDNAGDRPRATDYAAKHREGQALALRNAGHFFAIPPST